MYKKCIKVCTGKRCTLLGSREILADLCRKKHPEIEITESPCMSMCKQGPNMTLDKAVIHGCTISNVEKKLQRAEKNPTMHIKKEVSEKDIDSALDDLF